MKIVSKRALAGAAVLVAFACANPVDITGDVLFADPSDFGDAGLFAGAGGEPGAGSGGSAGEASQGGTGPDGGGGTGNPSGGTGGGSGGTGDGSGGTFQVGIGGAPLAGTGGTPSAAGSGGAPLGGSGGAGSAGTGSSAGTGGGTAGTGGTGVGAEPVFDAASCDFEDPTGCEELTCAQVCPTTDGGSCSTRCEALVTCVSTNPACTISEEDPLCAARDVGQPNACTSQADNAGGAQTTQPTQPAFVARQFVECICTTPRP